MEQSDSSSRVTSSSSLNVQDKIGNSKSKGRPARKSQRRSDIPERPTRTSPRRRSQQQVSAQDLTETEDDSVFSPGCSSYSKGNVITMLRPSTDGEDDDSDDSSIKSNEEGSTSDGEGGEDEAMFVLDNDTANESEDYADLKQPGHDASTQEATTDDSERLGIASSSEATDNDRWLSQLSSAVLSMVPGSSHEDGSSNDSVAVFVNKLKARDSHTDSNQLALWLQELAEILALIMDDYGQSPYGSMSSSSTYSTLIGELLRILNEPCSAENMFDSDQMMFRGDEGMDPDLAAAIAASMGHESHGTHTGITVNVKILACRCLSNLCAAVPTCVPMVIAQEGVKALVSLLGQMEFIDLTEQVLAVLKRVSAEAPFQLIKHRGFAVVLQYVEFFSLHDQRVAVEIACNAVRGLGYLSPKSEEAGPALQMVEQALPILLRLATYDDAKVAELSTKCLLRCIDWVSRTQSEDAQEAFFFTSGLLEALAKLLKASGSSLSSSTASASVAMVLKCLTSMNRQCPKVGIRFFKQFDGLLLLQNILKSDVESFSGPGSGDKVQDKLSATSFQHEAFQFLQELLPTLPQAAEYSDCKFKDVWFWTRKAASREADAIPSHSERAARTSSKKIELWSSEHELVDSFAQEMVPLLLLNFQSTGASSVRRRVIQTVSQFLHLWSLVFEASAHDKHLFRTKALSHAFGRFLADTMSGIGREVVFSLSKLQSRRNSEHSASSPDGASAETVTFFCAVLGLTLLALKLDSDIFGTIFVREGVQADLEDLFEFSNSLSAPNVEDAVDEAPASALNEAQRSVEALAPRFSSTAPNFSSPFGMSSSKNRDTVFLGINGQPFDAKNVAQWVGHTITFVLSTIKGLDTSGAETVLDELKSLAARLKQPLSGAATSETLRGIAQTFAGSSGQVGATAYETLQSGVLGSIVAFLSVDDSLPAANELGSIMKLEAQYTLPIVERFELFSSVFIDSDTLAPGAFECIVQRAQEALDQLDHFQICMGCPNAFQSLILPLFFSNAPLRSMSRSTSSPAQLMKTMRIKLVADTSDSCVKLPPKYSVIMLSVLAIADFNFLEKFFLEKISHVLESAGDKSEYATGSTGSSSEDAIMSSDLSSEALAVMRGEPDDMDIFDDEVSKLSPDKKSFPASPLNDKYPDSIEFYIDDLRIEKKWTVFGALYKAESLAQQSQALRQTDDIAPVNVWAKMYSIRYKLRFSNACALLPTTTRALENQRWDQQLELATAGDAAVPDDVHCNEDFVLPFDLRVPKRLLKDEPLTWALLALRVLSGISSWEDHLFYRLEQRGTASRKTFLPKEIFFNKKIGFKFAQQLNEPLIVASNVLPNWCEILAREFPFLLSFDDRWTYLSSVHFGYARSIARWAALLPPNAAIQSQISEFGRAARVKVRVSRQHILDMMSKVMDKFGSSSAYLEVEFYDEVGTGLGPTLEFYSLIWNAAQQVSIRYKEHADLRLWRNFDGAPSDGHVTAARGLFPLPIAACASASVCESTLQLFERLGTAVTKALLDGRMVDLPLNPLFLHYMLDPSLIKTTSRKLRLHLLHLVDPSLCRALELIARYGQQGDGAAIEALCLDMTYPGLPQIELVSNGAQVYLSLANWESYVSGVLDHTIGSGVSQQLERFKAGFTRVFDVSYLQGMFSAVELGCLLGSNSLISGDNPQATYYRELEEREWQVHKIMACIHADHGYSLTSPIVVWTAEMLHEFTPQERRQALLFITGSSRLPIGGFAKLNPSLTVVLRPCEKNHKPDDYLPSVMTCVNYMKIPNYSCKQVLAAKFKTAMYEGQGSFHLS